MRATTKFKIHNGLILPISFVLWLICIIPIIIITPFEKLADWHGSYIRNRSSRLMKKYDVGLYMTPDNKTILKEN